LSHNPESGRQPPAVSSQFDVGRPYPRRPDPAASLGACPHPGRAPHSATRSPAFAGVRRESTSARDRRRHSVAFCASPRSPCSRCTAKQGSAGTAAG
jgi:hypothetical protein